MAGTPCSVRVMPAALSLKHSAYVAPAAGKLRAGQACTFHVELRDQHSNKWVPALHIEHLMRRPESGLFLLSCWPLHCMLSISCNNPRLPLLPAKADTCRAQVAACRLALQLLFTQSIACDSMSCPVQMSYLISSLA